MTRQALAGAERVGMLLTPIVASIVAENNLVVTRSEKPPHGDFAVASVGSASPSQMSSPAMDRCSFVCHVQRLWTPYATAPMTPSLFSEDQDDAER